MALLVVAGCGAVPHETTDGPLPGPDATRADAGPDAGCVDTVILAGGVDPAAQGWVVEQAGFAVLTMPDPTTTQLETMSGGITGGATLVLRKDAAVTPDRPFIIELVMQVVLVDPHNSYNTAAALIGSYTPYPGTLEGRRQLVYVDDNAVGWSDDSESFPVDATDGAFHTYRLAVDAAGNATVSRDGVDILSRTGFTTNGVIAVGDQTSQIFVESTVLIRSISKICP
jgi:hypothetical protein